MNVTIHGAGPVPADPEFASDLGGSCLAWVIHNICLVKLVVNGNNIQLSRQSVSCTVTRLHSHIGRAVVPHSRGKAIVFKAICNLQL